MHTETETLYEVELLTEGGTTLGKLEVTKRSRPPSVGDEITLRTEEPGPHMDRYIVVRCAQMWNRVSEASPARSDDTPRVYVRRVDP